MLALRERLQGPPPLFEYSITALLLVFVVFSVISISVMQAAYILAVVLWLFRLCTPGNHRQVHLPLLWPLSSFALASLLATLTAVAPLRSLIALRHVLEVAVFFLVLNHVSTTARATTLVQVLIATGTVIALYGLWQSLTYGIGFRIHGTMSIYMTFAGLLMLVYLMALAQAVYRGHGWHIAWYVVALVCLTGALLLTHTRSAWLGLLAGGCVVLGLRHKALLLAVPLLSLLVLLLVPGEIRERAGSILDLQHATAQERLSMWASALRIWRDHPWTGIGMGAMRETYPLYREPDSPVEPDRRLGHVHNNVLQVAVERGSIGLACWLWIWLAYGYHWWAIYRALPPGDLAARALVVGSLAGVLGFHVEGLFEHTFGDAEVVTLVYALMALPFVVQRSYCGAQHAQCCAPQLGD